jgi:hypothetical protein
VKRRKGFENLEHFQKYCGHGLEGCPKNSARFWTAAALCRFSTAGLATQSGRGLPQSKTLPRDSLTPGQLNGYSIFEPAPGPEGETGTPSQRPRFN